MFGKQSKSCFKISLVNDVDHKAMWLISQSLSTETYWLQGRIRTDCGFRGSNQVTGAIDSCYIVTNDRETSTISEISSAKGNFVFWPPFFDYSKSFGGQLCNNYPCIKSILSRSHCGWLLLKCSTVGIGFNGTETNCGIAHILGILLMNSYNTVIFLATTINLQSVHFALHE